MSHINCVYTEKKITYTKTDNEEFICKYGLITLVFEAVHLHMMKAHFSLSALLLKHLDADCQSSQQLTNLIGIDLNPNEVFGIILSTYPEETNCPFDIHPAKA